MDSLSSNTNKSITNISDTRRNGGDGNDREFDKHDTKSINYVCYRDIVSANVQKEVKSTGGTVASRTSVSQKNTGDITIKGQWNAFEWGLSSKRYFLNEGDHYRLWRKAYRKYVETMFRTVKDILLTYKKGLIKPPDISDFYRIAYNSSSGYISEYV